MWCIADLHGVRGVSVVEYHCFLDVLVVAFQFVDVGSERGHLLIESVQSRQVIFQLAPLHACCGDGVEVALDPLADHVRLLSERTTQTLIVLLSHQFVTQHRVTVGHKLFHFMPLVRQILPPTYTVKTVRSHSTLFHSGRLYNVIGSVTRWSAIADCTARRV